MKNLFLVLIVCTIWNNSFAQLGEENKGFIETVKNRFKNSPRSISYGWSFIDDNGDPYTDVFSPKSFTTNFIPATVKYDRYYYQGFSVNTTASFCYFKRTKVVNNYENTLPTLLFAADFNVRYSLNRVYNINYELFKLKRSMFDVYFSSGFGYVNRDIFRFDQSVSYNLGGGFYGRFSKNFGMNMELMGKLGLKSPLILTNSNFIHGSIGVTYFVGEVKYKTVTNK